MQEKHGPLPRGRVQAPGGRHCSKRVGKVTSRSLPPGETPSLPTSESTHSFMSKDGNVHDQHVKSTSSLLLLSGWAFKSILLNENVGQIQEKNE